jgi:tRNA (cytosine34-C5)-methyltransferase
MRLLPHHEDSGGFFVAVLYKKSTLPWRKKEKSDKKPNDVSREDQTSQPHYSGGKEVLEGEGKETKSGADVLKKTEGSESIEKPTESPLDRLRIFTRKKRNRGFKEDPFVFVEEGNELWEQIRWATRFRISTANCGCPHIALYVHLCFVYTLLFSTCGNLGVRCC